MKDCGRLCVEEKYLCTSGQVLPQSCLANELEDILSVPDVGCGVSVRIEEMHMYIYMGGRSAVGML